MLYKLYVIGFYLTRTLPIRACYWIADAAAYSYYIFSKKDRHCLAENLKMVLMEKADKRTINKHIRGVFRNFARYLADFFKFSKLTPECFNKKIEVVGIHNLDKCLSGGKGAITLSPHLGNWELGAAIIAAHGYPVTAVVLEHKDKRVDDFFTQQRSINNLKVVPLGIQLRQCFTVLKDNGVLAIAGDKDYTSSGEFVDFFGKGTAMPKGAAVFSLKTGAPIVVCACVRKKNDEFQLSFEEPIVPEQTGDYQKDLHNLMERYISIFERVIRKYPDQWYAFQEIWKQEPATQ
ncbi:MAG: lysophospholipid acyltransferase family protein [Candidatus Omnitrophota bacterium]